MTTRRIIVIVTALTLTLLAVYFGYQFATRNGETTEASTSAKLVARDFVTAITQGQDDKVYSLGTERYKAVNTREAIKSFSATVISDNVRILNEAVQYDHSQVSSQAVYSATVDNLPPSRTGSLRGTFVVRMVYEQGAWRVDSLKVS